jgi:hypothetical protein
MQKQIWKLPGNIAQPFKGMCLDFLPELSVFVPYPQHKTIIENPETVWQCPVMKIAPCGVFSVYTGSGYAPQ